MIVNDAKKAKPWEEENNAIKGDDNKYVMHNFIDKFEDSRTWKTKRKVPTQTIQFIRNQGV
jgi:hypothetical protein